jgi:ATP-dependent Clp protease ATP-binding subunit ClpA
MNELSQSPRYNNIIATAKQTARDMGRGHVGVEHLFLAIIDDKNAVPTQILSKTVNISELRVAIMAVINSKDYATSSRRVFPAPEDN